MGTLAAPSSSLLSRLLETELRRDAAGTTPDQYPQVLVHLHHDQDDFRDGSLQGGFHLGTTALDAAKSNYLEMRVRAEDRTNTVAVADVLWVSPLALPLPGFIRDVQVDPGDITVCVTWTGLRLVQDALAAAGFVSTA